MRCVVLGVNGLTGRAVAAELARAGWEVVGTGRDVARFPEELRCVGVEFVQSDRRDMHDLAAVLDPGADLAVDCVCYTADQARDLLAFAPCLGAIVSLSSKAVYVDSVGRHSNSDQPPDFGRQVDESCAVLEPDFSGDHETRVGYGANKVAMEQVLLEAAVPVSILRPCRIYGPGASRPREWFVVKRLLDGRQRIPLAHHGRTGNHPTASANLAALVRVCAEQPGTRVLNAADPGTPSAGYVVRAVAYAQGVDVEVVGLDDAAGELGWSPWNNWPPFYLDTTAAQTLGYVPVGDYSETVGPAVNDLLHLSRREQDQRTADPYFAGRFDYRLDDEALRRAPAAPPR